MTEHSRWYNVKFIQFPLFIARKTYVMTLYSPVTAEDNFPIVEYALCSKASLRKELYKAPPESVLMGATWNSWADEPWYNIRVKIFEIGLWPYDIDCHFNRTFKCTYGVALKHIQPYTLVDHSRPDTVYLLDLEKRLFGKMRFIDDSRIQLWEMEKK